MQRLEYRNKPSMIPREYEDDVTRIVYAFAEHGYEVGVLDAYRAWKEFSDDADNSWMFLPAESRDIVAEAIPYLREA